MEQMKNSTILTSKNKFIWRHSYLWSFVPIRIYIHKRGCGPPLVEEYYRNTLIYSPFLHQSVTPRYRIYIHACNAFTPRCTHGRIYAYSLVYLEVLYMSSWILIPIDIDEYYHGIIIIRSSSPHTRYSNTTKIRILKRRGRHMRISNQPMSRQHTYRGKRKKRRRRRRRKEKYHLIFTLTKMTTCMLRRFVFFVITVIIIIIITIIIIIICSNSSKTAAGCERIRRSYCKKNEKQKIRETYYDSNPISSSCISFLFLSKGQS